MGKKKLFDEDFLRRLERLGMIAKTIPISTLVAGQRRATRFGDGLEFADHRAYAPGDDIRFLDWPYYARMERLLIRLFHQHSEGMVSILLDCSGSMGLGEICKFDYARKAAAALGYVAMVALDRVKLQPFSQDLAEPFTTGRNRSQVLQLLDYLEYLPAASKTVLGKCVQQYIGQTPQPATIIIISDMLDIEEDLHTALAALRQHRDEIILLHIVDPVDAAPVHIGTIQLQDTEYHQRLNINATKEVINRYKEKWREFALFIEKTAINNGATYLQAPTNLPLERIILQVLRNARILQR